MGRIYRARGAAVEVIADDHSLASVTRRRGETLDPADDSIVTRLLGVVARALAAPTVEESALRLGEAIGTAPPDDASAVIVALS